MGRLADKWARKMEAVFRTAIERAQAVTAREYAEAVAAAASEEAGRTVTADEILDELPIQNYVTEMGEFDVDAFLAVVDWSALSENWSSGWLEAYGIE